MTHNKALHTHVFHIVLFVKPSIRMQCVLTLFFLVLCRIVLLASCLHLLLMGLQGAMHTSTSVLSGEASLSSLSACLLLTALCNMSRRFSDPSRVALNYCTLVFSVIYCKFSRLSCTTTKEIEAVAMLIQGGLLDVHTTAWRSSHVLSHSSCWYIGPGLMSKRNGDLFIFIG